MPDLDAAGVTACLLRMWGRTGATFRLQAGGDADAPAALMRHRLTYGENRYSGSRS